MNIDTGGKYIGRGTSQADTRPVHSEHTILFDAASTYLQSGLIAVRPDAPILLVAYEVPAGAEFTVEMVSVGSRAVHQGGGCCSPCMPSIEGSTPVDILFRQPVMLGGNTWTINKYFPQIVINLPGTYILSLNDEQYLGSIHVEQVQLGKVKTHLPKEYLAGITSTSVVPN